MTSALLKSINTKIQPYKDLIKTDIYIYIMLIFILDAKRNLSHTIILFDAV